MACKCENISWDKVFLARGVFIYITLCRIYFRGKRSLLTGFLFILKIEHLPGVVVGGNVVVVGGVVVGGGVVVTPEIVINCITKKQDEFCCMVKNSQYDIICTFKRLHAESAGNY